MCGDSLVASSGSNALPSTMDCCLAMWHRVGGRNFTWNDVQDLLRSPSQLVGMRNRGYIKLVTESDECGKTYRPAVWQMTNQIKDLADIRAGRWD